MTTNAKTNMTYSLAYIHVPEAYSTLSYTHYYHTIPIALCIEQMRRRIIIYQLSHVYVYVHSTFGVITNICKQHREIDGSIWKIRNIANLQFAIDGKTWLIDNKFVRKMKWKLDWWIASIALTENIAYSIFCDVNI